MCSRISGLIRFDREATGRPADPSTPMAVFFWLGLGVLTFGLLVLGYGTGFWHFGG